MNKKNLIPLVILVILVIVYLIIKTNDNIEKRFEFFGIDSLDLAAFELVNAEDTLLVSKIDDSWMITYPIQYPPAQRKLNDFFSKVLRVETSNIPISESEETFETFNLTDSLGTTVRIYGKNNEVLKEAVIGKSSNFNFANARYTDEKKVYRLTTNITYNLDPKLSPWRQKEIFEIDEEEIAQIEVSYGDTLYTLTPTDSLWHYRDQNEEFAVSQENSALKGLLNNSRRLRATSFADGEFEKFREAFSDPLLQVKVKLFDQDEMNFSFVNYEDNQYAIRRNEETDVLFIVYEYMLKNFKKSAEEFRK